MNVSENLAKPKKLPVFSWCLYDFANSAFITLITTFVYSTYFTKAIAPNELVGTQMWSWGLTSSALVIALLSPILGAIADRGGLRKTFLVISILICVAATACLYPIQPGMALTAVMVFAIANIAFEMSFVFYNAYLPDIATPKTIGRISGYGWALGYVGGLLAMFLVMVMLIQPEQPWFGLSKDGGQNVRATVLVTGLWMLLFSLPIVLFVHDKKKPAPQAVGLLLRSSYTQLKNTFIDIKQYKHTIRFLFARLIYNDGLITVYAFGGIYAQGTFGFSMEKIMIFGIVLNVAAGLGAFAFGFLDDWIGGKRTIQLSLIGLILAAILAVFSPNETLFWIAGLLVGIFGGPNQSASRSLMGRFTPPDKENEFYGFFAFSGKLTAFLGPMLVGQLTAWFSSQRIGMSVTLLFFIIGLIMMHFVDEKAGTFRHEADKHS